ncbi:GSCOCG00007366001-RA-CDS [Cotesia congregata]|uniref:Similar to fpaA: SCF ubiquitin ligase complex protein SKP1a (Dictyostelium discoideum) n=1 Tax=Cotesia congregata TaxID=51543 RepID=A0A8J2EKW6_COTCN|nr:GSCOCG00007366001-RA-CDS [Cotesia congregata]CAG5076038.1 Similar to fpaA: SCF ubiquitin ligase complex protein SKP1a (Dictyostelium discoideum) [Cotesia congregata]
MADLELISADGKIFPVDKDVVNNWVTVTEMLELLQGESDSQVHLPAVNGSELKKIIDWSRANGGNLPRPNAEGDPVTVQLTEADQFYFASIENGELINVINAANYLGIERLLDVTTQLLADRIRVKEPHQIRAEFNLVNDLHEEDRAVLREEYELISNEL